MNKRIVVLGAGESGAALRLYYCRIFFKHSHKNFLINVQINIGIKFQQLTNPLFQNRFFRFKMKTLRTDHAAVTNSGPLAKHSPK